jgi:hypothetical protein
MIDPKLLNGLLAKRNTCRNRALPACSDEPWSSCDRIRRFDAARPLAAGRQR